MRLFIAIDLDNKEYFKEIQDQTPKAVMTHPKTFHLTLKFLGETDKQIEVVNILKNIKFKKFKIHTTNIGFFPSENYINVIWLGLEANKELIKLQTSIEKSLESFDFKKDFSDFKPHITLARVKFIKPEKKKEFVQSVKKIMIPEKEFEVNEFKLIKSELTKEGPVYGDVENFKSN